MVCSHYTITCGYVSVRFKCDRLLLFSCISPLK
nr:MAG TPA: hypothetical protein [Caudoviricetes sp.]